MFGGSKDVAFNKEISDLIGTVRVARTTWQTGRTRRTASAHGDDMPDPAAREVRQLPERHALVIAENGKPIIARLHRCIDGKTGASAPRPAGRSPAASSASVATAPSPPMLAQSHALRRATEGYAEA